jgi:hypothetical protein
VNSATRVLRALVSVRTGHIGLNWYPPASRSYNSSPERSRARTISTFRPYDANRVPYKRATDTVKNASERCARKIASTIFLRVAVVVCRFHGLNCEIMYSRYERDPEATAVVVSPRNARLPPVSGRIDIAYRVSI